MDGQWATLLSPSRAREQSWVLPSRRVVIGVSQRQRTWTQGLAESLRELERKERSGKPMCVLSSAEVHGGAETNRWIRKEGDFHELVGLLEFLFVPRWPVLEMHPPIELHRHRGRILNNGQFLTTSYTSLYSILDKYHYSKAPSPGVNELYIFWNRFTCKIILILIQPHERNLWSQPSKSFIDNKVDTWDGHAYHWVLEERLQCATRTEGMLFSR